MNNQLEKIYEQSIQINFWTINRDGIVNLNRDVDKYFEQSYQKLCKENKLSYSFWRKISTHNLKQKLSTVNFEQKYQHSIWTEISTIMFEQKRQQTSWTELTTYNFKQKNQQLIWINK